MWIVDASNADPGIVGCRPIAVPYCDHVGICRPKRKEDTIHISLVRWIIHCLKVQRKGTKSPVLEDEIKDIFKEIVSNEPSR
jgi:hypothetical protein